MAASIRIIESNTGRVVHELPCDVFDFRPQYDDHIKLLAPMMVFLKRGLRVEYIGEQTAD